MTIMTGMLAEFVHADPPDRAMTADARVREEPADNDDDDDDDKEDQDDEQDDGNSDGYSE
jgi:hypothetical protein